MEGYERDKAHRERSHLEEDPTFLEDETLSVQAWQGAQEKSGWGWRREPQDLPDDQWSEDVPDESTECLQWPWPDLDDSPCSPRRPGTRQGRRAKEQEDPDPPHMWIDEAQGWADFVNRQTWDGQMSSDSEEEQLFAMVGHTAIMAQDFSSLDDPEPELEVQGFAPRDLWVVEEEEEVSEEERKESEEEVTDAEAEVEKNKDDCLILDGLVDMEMPGDARSENEELTWKSDAKCGMSEMLFQASESDDTAETECMSSLAPTECVGTALDDDDDEHNDDELDEHMEKDAPEILSVDERASGKDDDLSQKVQDEAYSRSTECSDQGEPRAYTAASLLQAVYRGRLARLELFRACAAGTPANWRSLRLRTETAMARSAEEVAARVLQAAWRSCQARKDANWHGNANDANVFAGRHQRQVRSKDKDERGREAIKPRPPAGKAAPGPRRRADAQAVSDEGCDVHDEADRHQELRTRQRPHSSKSSGLSDRPPRQTSRGERRRPSVSELLSQIQDVPTRSCGGGLPRLGLSGRTDSRHRAIPAPSCARASAESPRSSRVRRGALTTLASPRRSWG